MRPIDSFKTQKRLHADKRTYTCFSLPKLGDALGMELAGLPVSIRILIENLLRNEEGKYVTQAHIESLSRWKPEPEVKGEVPFMPARVLMQDFTGVPAVVDLAAMRDALGRLGGNPKKINPRIPVELVIDHSVQVDRFGCKDAFNVNAEKEMERNRERYTFLKWGQKNFEN